MSKVLIDTDIAIDFLRGDSRTKKLIESLWFDNCAYMSILSIYELHAGMKENESTYTQNFIRACQIQQLTPNIASQAGDYYRLQRRRGITLTSIDCLIYMTAKHHNLKLLTRNIKHYPDKEILLIN